MTSSPVRVRFAPSPTGYLHIGGARTALFNWLFARHEGGRFILRIEDTDQTRVVDGAIDAIYDGLRWLGLLWDEGPDVGGPMGPYVQSQRLDIYRQHIAGLLASGHAYRCFCTEQRLTELREGQRLAKQSPGYDRRCRNLSPAEVDAAMAGGTPYVVRMKIPLTGETRFEDAVRGVVVYDNRVLDDFVLFKSDGFPTYHLANVVDDHLMRITHVIRGEEWIPSTPKHMLLYDAFGWSDTIPKFVHVPSILSPDGGKLSKRKGAAAVTDFADMGFLPEAVRNFIALLGWSPGEDREKMSVEELIAAFSLDRVNPKGAIFDETKLEWLNGEYIKDTPAEELLPRIAPLWVLAGLITEDEVEKQRDYLCRTIELFKGRMHRTPDFVDLAAFCLRAPATFDEKAKTKHWSDAEVPERLDAAGDAFAALPDFTTQTTEDAIRLLSEAEQVGAAKFIHPIRLAVSGMSFGPGLFEMLEVLGKEPVVERLRSAATLIRQSRTGTV
jgi:glutamyl-tRNA synthetase